MSISGKLLLSKDPDKALLYAMQQNERIFYHIYGNDIKIKYDETTKRFGMLICFNWIVRST